MGEIASALGDFEHNARAIINQIQPVAALPVVEVESAVAGGDANISIFFGDISLESIAHRIGIYLLPFRSAWYAVHSKLPLAEYIMDADGARPNERWTAKIKVAIYIITAALGLQDDQYRSAGSVAMFAVSQPDWLAKAVKSLNLLSDAVPELMVLETPAATKKAKQYAQEELAIIEILNDPTKELDKNAILILKQDKYRINMSIDDLTNCTDLKETQIRKIRKKFPLHCGKIVKK